MVWWAIECVSVVSGVASRVARKLDIAQIIDIRAVVKAHAFQGGEGRVCSPNIPTSDRTGHQGVQNASQRWLTPDRLPMALKRIRPVPLSTSDHHVRFRKSAGRAPSLR